MLCRPPILVPALLFAASASAQSGDRESLAARLDAETAGAPTGPTARAAEVRALVNEVRLDAETRASLLQDGATGGWDGHPFLASADGDFRLQFEGRLQFRYVLSHQDDALLGEDATRGGFESRRVRMIFSGHALDPSLTYKVQATYLRNGGDLRLEDAIIQKDFDGWYLRGGQFRPPFSREADVSTYRTTAAERSLAHSAIQIRRSQGFEVGTRGEHLSLRICLYSGDGVVNLPALATDTEFAGSARAEWLVGGNWRSFRDFNGWRGDEPGLLLGAGVLYEHASFWLGPLERGNDFRWTADASAKFDGAHVYAAVGGRSVDRDHGNDTDVLVAVAQTGWFLTDDIEAFARYEWGDDDTADDLSLATVGAAKYWSRHNLKWTTDFGYAFTRVTSTFARSGAGWRPDPAGADGQFVVRSQLQLMF